jgi:hypothetical protein
VIDAERTSIVVRGKNLTIIPDVNGDLYAFSRGGLEKFPVTIAQLVDRFVSFSRNTLMTYL